MMQTEKDLKRKRKPEEFKYSENKKYKDLRIIGEDGPTQERKMSRFVKTHFCSTCQITCSGPLSYNQHVDSAKHRKKAQLLENKVEGSNDSSDSCSIVHSTLEPASPKAATAGSSYRCDDCQVSMSGPAAYTAHMVGARHARRVKLKSGLSGDSTFQPAPGLSYYCDVCHTSMTGPEAYAAHMAGGPHAKKVKQIKVLLEITGMNTDNVQPGTSDITATGNVIPELDLKEKNDGHLHFCEICKVYVSGIINFQQHNQGIQHLKMMSRMGLSIPTAAGEEISNCSIEEKLLTEIDLEDVKAEVDVEVKLRQHFKDVDDNDPLDIHESH